MQTDRRSIGRALFRAEFALLAGVGLMPVLVETHVRLGQILDVGIALACHARLVVQLTKRRWTGLIVVTGLVMYFRVLRPWHMNWNATETEAQGPVAGDELMPGAGIVTTRVVEIEAPPSAIWPWLVQMGPGRGGAYTYDWIERRVGIEIRNVDRIIPEFQDLRVGDEVQMPGYRMRVERLDSERALVFRSSNAAWLWAFELRPTDGRTRLISRNSFDTSKLRLQDWLAYPIVEPGSWVMERKMLLTIKQRAETLAHTQARGPAAVTGGQRAAVAT